MKNRMCVLPLLIFLVVFSLVACTKEPINVNINFDSNGGASVNSIIYDERLSFNIPDNPTKFGYEFDGWFLDNEIFEIPFTIDSMLNQGDDNLTLYAKWKGILYTLRYIDTDGEILISVEYEYNFDLSTITIPVPIKEGYTFSGWFINELLTLEYEEEYIYTGAITFYAKWTEDVV